MGIIAGNDMAALQHQTDQGPRAKIAAAVTPIKIFFEIFKHPSCERMPDT